MFDPICTPDIRRERRGLRTWYLTPPLTAEEVAGGLQLPGVVLKQSKKSLVCRMGGWVVKTDRAPLVLRVLRHTFRRGRYRRAWVAAHHLHGHGVGVPRPLAYGEDGVPGLGWRNQLVTEYLPDHLNVEDYLRRLVRAGAGPVAIEAFLHGLADAVNKLAATGAYHADLSGKNILTPDGRAFAFVDLDAVVLDAAYDDARRLRNHVQLYDSFCDELADPLLAPFIMRMLPPGHDPRVWLPRVRQGQRKRRARVLARWEKEGNPRLEGGGAGGAAGGAGEQ